MHKTLQALAEPHRLEIITLLSRGECSAGELVDALPIAQPTVSKHLGILRRAGLVRVRVDGNRRLYSLDAKPLVALDEWLAGYRHMWLRRIDALERHLDAKFPKS